MVVHLTREGDESRPLRDRYRLAELAREPLLQFRLIVNAVRHQQLADARADRQQHHDDGKRRP